MCEIPAFNETNYFDNAISEDVRCVIISDADESIYKKYINLFNEKGYIKKESLKREYSLYSSFQKNETGIFINYYNRLNEISIVTERNCQYFSYSDLSSKSNILPQITQINLEDFGMSYVIRLNDGRFIIIDGGLNYKIEAKKIFDILKKDISDDKPVIAAWIMTHAHLDHYRAFNTFAEEYLNEVIIEKFLVNFPDTSNMTRQYYALNRPEIKEEYSFENTCEAYHVKLMFENMKKYNAKMYVPHTGQTYKFADCVCEILSTVDDTYHLAEDSNSYSIVFKMSLGSQAILWTGDASFSDSKLLLKYGDYLKSDILQIPHHGFGCGKDEEQIACFDVINPDVCFLPVSDYNAYTKFCTYRNGTRHIMLNCGVKELITGDKTTTITLPYTPPAYKKDEIKNNVISGLLNSGSTCWVYTGLSTTNKDDFDYTILNMTNFEANIDIELYFESSKNAIAGIKAKVKANSLKTLSVINKEDVELNCKYHNKDSINVKGIPENEQFAVRFLSDKPVVISNKNHPSAYTKNY